MRSHEVKQCADNPLLFTWDILPGSGAVNGSCGASGKRDRAIGALVEALRRSPEGTRGEVKTASLNAIGNGAYVYGPVVVEAHHDARDSVTVRLW